MPTPFVVRADPLSRRVNTLVFFAFAFGIGLWAGAVPVMLQRTGTDGEGLGRALVCYMAAYVLGMHLAGRLATWIELRRLNRWLLLAHGASFFLLFAAYSPAGLTVGLTLLGLSAGALDLGMNAEGTLLEREAGRPVLTRMHAAASGAFALGAIGGSLLATRLGPGPLPWLSAGAVALALLALRRLGPRPPARPKAAPAAGAAGAETGPLPTAVAGAPRGRWRSVLVFGSVLGLSTAAEMTAQMWSARFLVAQAADLAALAGAGAALFASCQSIVRLFGDRLRHHLGDEPLIVGSLALAAAGFVVVGAAEGFAAGVAGFALVGLGTACIAPCTFAVLARQQPERPGAAIGAASLFSGCYRLPAPLLIGLVAARWSDAAAFFAVAAVIGLGALLLWRITRRSPGPW